MNHRGLFKAIKFFGSQAALAKAIGVSQQAISNWLNNRISIPYIQVLKIVKATQGYVTFEELAPYEKEMNHIIRDIINIFSHLHKNHSSCQHTSYPEKVNVLSTESKTHQKKKNNYNKGNKFMKDYSRVLSRFWIGGDEINIRTLGVEIQLVAIYLLTCPHASILGIYYLPIAYIAHDLGIQPSVVTHALESLKSINFCLYDERTEYVWVIDMAKDQIGDKLEPKDKRVKFVNSLFKSLPNLPFLSKFFKKYGQQFLIEEPRGEVPFDIQEEAIKEECL